MLAILGFFVLQRDVPTAALDRYVALRKSTPASSLEATAMNIRLKTVYDAKQGYRFEASGSGLDYTCVMTPQEMFDIDRVDKEYDSILIRRIGSPPSRITSATSLFPNWFLVDDFRKTVPPGTKFKSMGRKTVDNVAGDSLHADYNGNTEHIDLVIDDAGIPREVVQSGESMRGTYRREWKVRDLKAIPAPTAETFRLPIPDGYAPFSLDAIDGPIGKGSQVEFKGWQSTKGGALDLGKLLPKGGLVAVWGENSEPSRASATSLARIRAAGMAVVVLSDARTASGARGADGFDPTGKVVATMSLPSTPVFYRVDAKGIIQAAWLGYDRDAPGAFESDVLGRNR